MVPFIQPVLAGLFGALAHPESTENEYIMKAIMRVCSSVKSDVAAHIMDVLQFTATILAKVAANPRSPGFNHYLFETISCLIKNVCEADATAVTHFETFLVPIFTDVLGNEQCAEFAPYVYQIFAQLLEFRGDAASGPYRAMVPALLVPAQWENQGAIPALVRLLRSYLRRDAAQVVAADQVGNVLGIFQKLISLKTNDHHGLALLGAALEFLPEAVLQHYLPQVLHLLFERQRSAPTVKYTTHMVQAFATCVHARGFAVLHTAMNQVQAGMFAMVLDRIYIPNVGKVAGSSERHICALGTVDMLCRAPGVASEAALQPHWTNLLTAAIGLVSDEAGSGGDDDELALAQLSEVGGYTSVFCKLAYAASTEHDSLLGGKPSGAQYLAASLQQLMTAMPGQV